MASDDPQVATLETQLASLRADNPPRYALLESYARDLRDALEQIESNYISAKQLHETWTGPPVRPQILGQLLSTAAHCGILRIHANRSNRNRYDLTAYDRTRMQHLIQLLETQFD